MVKWRWIVNRNVYLDEMKLCLWWKTPLWHQEVSRCHRTGMSNLWWQSYENCFNKMSGMGKKKPVLKARYLYAHHVYIQEGRMQPVSADVRLLSKR